MVYVGLAVWMLLSFVVSFDDAVHKNTQKKLFLLLVFLFSALIMGLRGESVGIDTYSYKEKFDIIARTDILEIISNFYTSSLEIGYALFMKVCSLVVDNYFFFQMAYAVIFATLSAKFLHDNADNILIATVVFFGIGIYAIAFNVSRQMLAALLTANSWTYLRKGNKIKAISLVLVATTMHITAVVFLCAFLLYALRNKKKIFKYCLIILMFFALLFDKIMPLVARIFPVYYNYFANEKGTQSAGLVWAIWLIVSIMAIYIIYNHNRQHTATEHSIIAFFSIAWCVFNVIGLHFNYFERLGYYFMPFVVILFSQFEKTLNPELLKPIYKTGVCVAFLIYFLLSTWGSEQYAYTTLFGHIA